MLNNLHFKGRHYLFIIYNFLCMSKLALFLEFYFIYYFLYNRFLLVIYFIHISVYMSIPMSRLAFGIRLYQTIYLFSAPVCQRWRLPSLVKKKKKNAHVKLGLVMFEGFFLPTDSIFSSLQSQLTFLLAVKPI